MKKDYTEEELLDLIDALDLKIDEIDEQIDELKERIPDLMEEARDRAIMGVEQLKRERRRISDIVAGHMQALKEFK